MSGLAEENWAWTVDIVLSSALMLKDQRIKIERTVMA